MLTGCLRFLYTVCRCPDKDSLLCRLWICEQLRKRQMQIFAMQPCSHFAKMMQDAGRTMPCTDLHDSCGKLFVIGFRKILFPQDDPAWMRRCKAFDLFQKISLT